MQPVGDTPYPTAAAAAKLDAAADAAAVDGVVGGVSDRAWVSLVQADVGMDGVAWWDCADVHDVFMVDDGGVEAGEWERVGWGPRPWGTDADDVARAYRGIDRGSGGADLVGRLTAPDVLGPTPGVDYSAIASMVPGAQLAAVLEEVPVGRMGVHEVADSVAAWERLVAWAQAKQAEAITELTRRPEVCPDPQGRVSSLHPVPVTAGALCAVAPWTKPQSEKLVEQAVQLIGRYPKVHQALTVGRLDARKTQILLDALDRCDEQVGELIQRAVLAFVHEWTSVKTSRVVNELLHELDPAGAKKRHRQARARRDVWIEPGQDGMAWLVAYLPAEEAQAILAVLNAAADTEHHQSCADASTCTCPTTDRDSNAEQTGEGEHQDESQGESDDDGSDGSPGRHGGCASRTRAQRRADALTTLAWTSLAAGYLGGIGCADCGSPRSVRLASRHGRAVSVNVTVGLSTLLGLDERPAQLDGYGPIDAHTSRRLAAAGLWRWLGTAPAGGYLLDYGTTRYTPPQDLTDFILLRDQECVMPGCHHPAYRCDIDHRVPYPAGSTSACNCSALCEPCHLQKHHAGWNLNRQPGGRLRWTSPTGHTRTTMPARLGPDTPTREPPPF